MLNDGNVVDDLPSPKASNGDVGSGYMNGHKDRSAVLHRSLHHEPLRVISAKGHYLKLSNGQQIFDATGGAAVACLGHGDERYAPFLYLTCLSDADVVQAP